ncbi:putative L-aspartate decarboxylase [Lasiodiplodia hormozganensis]|uniref:L-aspartate decarboxylase n=1 Tax=Lasiodiplodia hormozganensis TaxID=869390 RepID=A0AA39X1I1_9PEZI|nr:putative L-aspartate decarboxylase [Lasiodiplodia hormozganensis]
MFGYNNDEKKESEPLGWGHITCDGTVANLESIWVARNLKFYPLSLKWAMEEGNPLAFIPKEFTVRTCHNELKEFRELSLWELLNLKPKTILDIPEQLHTKHQITPTFLQGALNEFNIQTCGKDALEQHFGIDSENGAPTIMVSSTRHYSWPKGGAVAGIGSKNIVGIKVDKAARVDLTDLEDRLNQQLEAKRPVYAVVAIIGSTEEGAVDPLQKILQLRQKFQIKGLSFLVHADAAWGGYFATMLCKGKEFQPADTRPSKKPKAPSSDDEIVTIQEIEAGEETDLDELDFESASEYVDSDVDELPDIRAGREPNGDGFVPSLSLRVETQRDLAALRYCDSITVDPHKAGYIPYPAGALTYRDGRLRFLVTWTSPYLSRGSVTSIGIYGVEGSKPGASAVSTWLSNKCIGLHNQGYGALLAEACFTSSMFSALWAAVDVGRSSFMCVPFNEFPSETTAGVNPQFEKNIIRKQILDKSDSKEFVKNPELMKLLRALGSDLNINAFALNWKYGDGTANTDVEEANYLMTRVVRRLSIEDPNDKPTKINFYLTSTEFEHELYGDCAKHFKERLQLDSSTNASLMVLRNVVMSPFATVKGTLRKAETAFCEVVEDEVKKCRERNSDAPDYHSFLIHGQQSICLSYRTMFHIGSHRRQVILAVDLDADGLEGYRTAKGKTEDFLVLKSAEKIPLTTLLDGAKDSKPTFLGNLTTKSNGILQSNITVTITSVIINRPLDARAHDDGYPSGRMPFYLYANNSDELHIDHLFTRCENIALSAGSVGLNGGIDVRGFLKPDANIEASNNTSNAAALIVTFEEKHEAAMQPFPETNAALLKDPDFFFRSGAKFAVKLWRDPRKSDVRTRGLLEQLEKESDKWLLGQGTLTLGEDVVADVEKLNRDPSVRPKEVTVARWRDRFRKIGKDKKIKEKKEKK